MIPRRVRSHPGDPHPHHETGAAAAKATATLQVDKQTSLVMHVEIGFAYADGKSFRATIDLSDYGVPNDIKPPI